MKNKLIYSLIGLLTLGGVVLVSSKSVYAANIQAPVNLSSNGTITNLSCPTNIYGSSPGDTGKSSMNVGTSIGLNDAGRFDSVYPLTCSDFNSAGTILSGYHLSFVGTGTWFASFFGTDGNTYYFSWTTSGGIVTLNTQPFIANTSTHFISVSPANGTTTATTSPLGADVYVNGDDIDGGAYGRLHIHAVQQGAFACINSGAVYDAVVTCAGSNSPAAPFDYDYGTSTLTKLIAGEYNMQDLVTFPRGGKWNITYTIQQVSTPWYCLNGLLCNSYSDILSTSTTIVIGSLSPIDIVQGAIIAQTASSTYLVNRGIGSILASTTASLGSACTPFSGSFNLGDCIVLLAWPGQSAIDDDFVIIKQLPPWGYAFRLIDILNATSSGTTMPMIDYTFATSSPMSVMGDIHFDPFGLIAQASALIGEMHSDRSDHLTVWQIMNPIVTIFVYMVLIFQIIHDLTGIHKHGENTHEPSEFKKNK